MDLSEAVRALAEMVDTLPLVGRTAIKTRRVTDNGTVVEREVTDIRFNGAVVVIETE